MMVAEALECLGGNGYVEESGMPLLFRESPLNSIWEGSGNVNALDVLRALSREPEALDAWIVEVGRARGEDPRLDRAIEARPRDAGRHRPALEVGARRLAGQMAACLQGALLVQHAPRRGRRRVLRHPARHASTAARSAPCPAAPTSPDRRPHHPDRRWPSAPRLIEPTVGVSSSS